MPHLVVLGGADVRQPLHGGHLGIVVAQRQAGQAHFGQHAARAQIVGALGGLLHQRLLRHRLQQGEVRCQGVGHLLGE